MSSPETSEPLSGSDPILQELKRLGSPLTRENYLSLMDPTLDPTEPLDAEIEASLPAQIQVEPADDDLSLPTPPPENPSVQEQIEAMSPGQRRRLSGGSDF